MRAIQYQEYGGYAKNKLVELKTPTFRGEGVLIRMLYAGINPLDDTFRSGHFLASTPHNLPRIGGQTGVGIVEASADPSMRPGTRVFVNGRGFGILVDGTWCDFLLTSPDSLLPIPDGINSEQAAAFLAGGGYVTGYLALTELANFKPGQTVLAPGIGGAVGMETIQIARELGAALTISTAGTKEKAELARRSGYENVIDLSTQSLTEELRRTTDGRGVDVVVDGIAGELYPQLLKGIAFGGSYVVVGYSGGRETQQDVTDIIWKAAAIRGFNPRALGPEKLRAALEACVKLLDQGRLRPTTAAVYPLSEISDAVRSLIEGRPFGRVLLKINE